MSGVTSYGTERIARGVSLPLANISSSNSDTTPLTSVEIPLHADETTWERVFKFNELDIERNRRICRIAAYCFILLCVINTAISITWSAKGDVFLHPTLFMLAGFCSPIIFFAAGFSFYKIANESQIDKMQRRMCITNPAKSKQIRDEILRIPFETFIQKQTGNGGLNVRLISELKIVPDQRSLIALIFRVENYAILRKFAHHKETEFYKELQSYTREKFDEFLAKDFLPYLPLHQVGNQV